MVYVDHCHLTDLMSKLMPYQFRFVDENVEASHHEYVHNELAEGRLRTKAIRDTD